MQQKEVFYVIESHTPILQTFQLKLAIYGQNSYTFTLGSAKLQNCVTISFETEGIGELSNLFHDVKCNENGDLQRGENGTIVMVYVALFCVKKLYPYNIQKITFEDASDIECYNDIIALSYFKFFTTGKTWYEKYFPATPVGEIKHKIDRVRNTLSKPVNIPVQRFSDLLEIRLNEMNGHVLYHVVHLYSECFSLQKSWLQFFSIVKEDRLLGCRFFSVQMIKMLRTLFSLPNLYYSEWEIQFDKLDFSKYDIQGKVSNSTSYTAVKEIHNGGSFRRRIQWYGKTAR